MLNPLRKAGGLEWPKSHRIDQREIYVGKEATDGPDRIEGLIRTINGDQRAHGAPQVGSPGHHASGDAGDPVHGGNVRSRWMGHHTPNKAQKVNPLADRNNFLSYAAEMRQYARSPSGAVVRYGRPDA